MLRPITTLGLLALTLAAVFERAGAQQGAQPTARAVVEGTVYDTVSGRPIRLAIIRVAETGASTLTDNEGRYRVPAVPGGLRLEVRRIGYQPASVSVAAREGTTRLDLYLRPAAIGLEPVTVTTTDDLARRIMARAIARKNDLFSKIHDYRYDAYVKFVVRDLGKAQDSAASVMLITETRTSAYWEQPNRYQETILSRRQSNNLDAERNLISAGQIVNFSRNRIDLQKYSIVSPVADDALDHYEYAVLDTLAVDGRRVFRLAIQPKSEVSPLFVGMIDVADSTYDVLAIDVGVNDAVRFALLENVRYRQRLKDVGGGWWMPYEIRLSGEVHLRLPGVPHMAFEHVASLNGLRFDEGNRPPDLGEFRIVVSEQADRADSAMWTAPGALPLTDTERAGWARIDSLQNRSPTVGRLVGRGLGATLWLSANPDFFHFNRVDGAYLGAGRTWREIPGLRLTSKLGYATGSETWQYQFGGHVRLSEARRLWVGGSYHDETVSRPSLVSRGSNPTYWALFLRLDPLDYYRERGLTLTLSTKLLDFTRLDLQYNDQKQSSLGVVTDYSVFSVDRPQRPNPATVDGRLRALSGRLTYDSRPLLKSKDRDYYLQRFTWARITLGVEVAAPDLIPDDFDFRRYSFQIERRQRTGNLGLTTIAAAGGIATSRVPPQRYFTVGFGMAAVTFQEGGFNTLGETNFSGTRAALVTVCHDFDRLLFAQSGLPLVRDLPFTLSVHGGVFWTDFVGHTPNPGDALLNTAPTAYSELGFGVGNLSPFIAPFNFAAHFTWQLSSYPTRGFRFALGLTGP